MTTTTVSSPKSGTTTDALSCDSNIKRRNRVLLCGFQGVAPLGSPNPDVNPAGIALQIVSQEDTDTGFTLLPQFYTQENKTPIVSTCARFSDPGVSYLELDVQDTRFQAGSWRSGAALDARLNPQISERIALPIPGRKLKNMGVSPFLRGFTIPSNTADSALNIDIWASQIDDTGFTLNVKTWDRCAFSSVSVDWIAYSEDKDEKTVRAATLGQSPSGTKGWPGVSQTFAQPLFQDVKTVFTAISYVNAQTDSALVGSVVADRTKVALSPSNRASSRTRVECIVITD
ncbi:hypothetical protein OC844_000237 [Tilletia horrida]|nr:hypothetical protein OC844_000237 [Tilletia horrida]